MNPFKVGDKVRVVSGKFIYINIGDVFEVVDSAKTTIKVRTTNFGEFSDIWYKYEHFVLVKENVVIVTKYGVVRSYVERITPAKSLRGFANGSVFADNKEEAIAEKNRLEKQTPGYNYSVVEMTWTEKLPEIKYIEVNGKKYDEEKLSKALQLIEDGKI
jgi:hypothetical protein